jgi:hypothetical protein
VVGAAASKEAGLEKALSKMQSDWDGVAFRVVEYKDTGTFVIGGTDEVQVGVNAVYWRQDSVQLKDCTKLWTRSAL